MKKSGSAVHRSRVEEALRQLTEEVLIVTLNTGTGNSKVLDASGRTFLCNTADLSEIYEGFYSVMN